MEKEEVTFLCKNIASLFAKIIIITYNVFSLYVFLLKRDKTSSYLES